MAGVLPASPVLGKKQSLISCLGIRISLKQAPTICVQYWRLLPCVRMLKQLSRLKAGYELNRALERATSLQTCMRSLWHIQETIPVHLSLMTIVHKPFASFHFMAICSLVPNITGISNKLPAYHFPKKPLAEMEERKCHSKICICAAKSVHFYGGKWARGTRHFLY